MSYKERDDDEQQPAHDASHSQVRATVVIVAGQRIALAHSHGDLQRIALHRAITVDPPDAVDRADRAEATVRLCVKGTHERPTGNRLTDRLLPARRPGENDAAGPNQDHDAFAAKSQ